MDTCTGLGGVEMTRLLCVKRLDQLCGLIRTPQLTGLSSVPAGAQSLTHA